MTEHTIPTTADRAEFDTTTDGAATLAKAPTGCCRIGDDVFQGITEAACDAKANGQPHSWMEGDCA